MAELKRFAPPSYSSFGNSPSSFAETPYIPPAKSAADHSAAVPTADTRDASVGFKSKGSAAKGALKAGDGAKGEIAAAAAFGAYSGAKGTHAANSDGDDMLTEKKK